MEAFHHNLQPGCKSVMMNQNCSVIFCQLWPLEGNIYYICERKGNDSIKNEFVYIIVLIKYKVVFSVDIN